MMHCKLGFLVGLDREARIVTLEGPRITSGSPAVTGHVTLPTWETMDDPLKWGLTNQLTVAKWDDPSSISLKFLMAMPW